MLQVSGVREVSLEIPKGFRSGSQGILKGFGRVPWGFPGCPWGSLGGPGRPWVVLGGGKGAAGEAKGGLWKASVFALRNAKY